MILLRRVALGLTLATAISLPMTTATAAAEIPTGAARIVQKVQLQILTAKNTLLYTVGQIQANHAPVPGK